MLKPADPGPHADRPVGELIHQLVEDGKAYASAEVELAKAIATAKGRALGIAAALLGIALVVALAAVTALSAGVVLALTKWIGPLAAGLAALLIFAAIAAGIAWLGVQRLMREL